VSIEKDGNDWKIFTTMTLSKLRSDKKILNTEYTEFTEKKLFQAKNNNLREVIRKIFTTREHSPRRTQRTFSCKDKENIDTLFQAEMPELFNDNHRFCGRIIAGSEFIEIYSGGKVGSIEFDIVCTGIKLPV